MSTFAIKTPPQAQNINCTDANLVVDLIDGRTISVPLEWFPRLSEATPSHLQNWEPLGNGERLHWLELDDDLSVAWLLSSNHDYPHLTRKSAPLNEYCRRLVIRQISFSKLIYLMFGKVICRQLRLTESLK